MPASWNILLILVSALAPAFAGAQPPSRPDSLGVEHVRQALGKRIDSVLTTYQAHGFSGTVLVVQRGKIVLLKGYGFADIAGKVRNRPNTRFEMNSITKMFTAASILQLASSGKLRLDDRVSRHLGEFPEPKSSATINHLAMHTGGLAVAGTQLPDDSRESFVAAMKAAPMESPPGERYRYTNAGYSLLAAIVEVASGQRFEDYLRQHVFVPAGMQTAIFRNAVPVGDARFAHGYVASRSGPVRGADNPYGWGTTGAGGVWSTVGDIYRYVVAMQRNEIIPREYRAVLFSPPPAPSLQAYGWHVYAATDTSRTRIDKGGGSDDFASQLLHFPDDRVTIIWACNNLERRWRPTLNRALPELVFTGVTRAASPN